MINHKVKYMILILPTFILTVVLLYLLPPSKSFLAMSPLFLGWIVYYTWRYVENKSDNEKTI
ncbi:hypothetical protein [Jeotgalibacillus proteolyticus]|uniref:Uncharacterized protein n=1 Tax=Jeotgalibacillus proteolyticus TaxID=2082395 RepID=A0A2S5GD43_9BACL|nr:hypothetical protein [Jeotgalibacillus proteolyticus]PPA70916.1 hypothetical protein C4B60_09010 [Jeotgalibacillus proteolyticus]